MTALVVGVGLATRGKSTPAASTPPLPPVQDVRALNGSWDVDLLDPGADDADLRVELSGRSGQISQSGCGAGFTWQGHSDGLLHADVSATFGTGGCPGPAQQGWLAGTGAFDVVDADTVDLLRATGEPVAALTRTSDVVALDGPADAVAPLPDDLRAPTSADVEGRWTDVDVPAQWLAFDADRWSTSPDGCITISGDFLLSEFGGLLRSLVMDTAVAECGDALPDWPVTGIERLGLDGDVLVLLDAGGTELARLERAPGSGPADVSVLEAAQGRWASVGPLEAGKPFPGLWLDVDGDVLSHAEDASCNIDPIGYTLSAEGEVTGTVDAYGLGKLDVICQPDFPDLVPGRVGRIALDRDQLVLLDPGGSEIARFDHAEQ